PYIAGSTRQAASDTALMPISNDGGVASSEVTHDGRASSSSDSRSPGRRRGGAESARDAPASPARSSATAAFAPAIVGRRAGSRSSIALTSASSDDGNSGRRAVGG